MLVTLVEVVEERQGIHNKRRRGRSKHSLREVTVNPSHVVCLRRFCHVSALGRNQTAQRHGFTSAIYKVYLDRGQSGLDLTVVGSLQQVQERLHIQRRSCFVDN